MSRKSASNALTIQSIDPSRLAGQVSDILNSGFPEKEIISQLLHLAVRLVNGAGALFVVRHENQIRQKGAMISQQAYSWSEDIAGELTQNAALAIQQGKACITTLAKEASVSVFSCPVPGGDDYQDSCLTVLVLLGESPPESFLIILELMAVALSQAIMGKSRLQSELFGTSGLLHLLFQDNENHTLDLQTICDVLRDWSGCATLAVSFANDKGKLRLRFVSDMVKIDSRTRKSRQFVEVMQESQQQQQSMLWPGRANDTRYEHSLLLKGLVTSQGMQQGAALFLPGTGRAGTALVFLWSKQADRTKHLEQIEYVAPLLGPAFQTILSVGRQHLQKSGEISTWKKKKLFTALFFAALAILCFVPKTFYLHPDCQLKPVHIRYVSARFDGILKQVFVEPGDRVKQGTVLALLDGREIELELHSLEADIAKALKMRDNYLAAGEIAPAQIARLEADRLRERSRLLSERKQQLELQSPLDGIVLSGDLKQNVGGPVGRGQLLFEIAPLETIVAELAVADEDISYVKNGMNVSVQFDAFPGRTWQGTVERIAPQSEIISGENVFPVIMTLENNGGALQPGMQGMAAIDCGQRSIVWIYFHKPWHALCRLFKSLS